MLHVEQEEKPKVGPQGALVLVLEFVLYEILQGLLQRLYALDPLSALGFVHFNLKQV